MRLTFQTHLGTIHSVICPTLQDMKRLFVIRHGKAEPSGGRPDVERTLTNRGENDASKLGQWTRDVRVPRAPLLTSPASRTLATAEMLCQAWDESTDAIHVQPEAYLASDRAWLSWIAQWSDNWESGWIVGHNPGVSELVERLTDQPIWMPTCGLAEVELQISSWEEAFAGTGRLRSLITPKSMLIS